jgi:ribonuclease BN (tRNA processing enzyme)
MELTIFESDMGDCLLLEAETGELMLCDGGMKKSLQEHVRAELATLQAAGRDMELVYVSHVDNDHINGVLQLLEDEAEWRVFDRHEADGDPIRRPKFPRPPKIKGILHNAFHAQVKANNKEIASLLVASASSLYASAVPDLIDAANEMQAIATGIKEALLVSEMIGPKALRIPLNKPPGAAKETRLLYAGRPGATFRLGSMKLTLIGPTS